MYPISSRVHADAMEPTRRWRLGSGLRFSKARSVVGAQNRGLTPGDATAIIALILSVTTFYVSYFYVKHSLKVSVARFAPEDTQLPTRLVGDLVLLNHGNRTETLLAAELVIRGFGTISDPELIKKTLVIKPGDTEPLKISWQITAKDLDLIRYSEHSMSTTMPIELRLTSVTDSSGPRETLVPLGSLTYRKPLNSVMYIRGRSSIGGRLIELVGSS